MKKCITVFFTVFILSSLISKGQVDSVNIQLRELQSLLMQLQQMRYEDSLRKGELQIQFNRININDKSGRELILLQLNELERKDSLRKVDMLSRINYLKESSMGYPVTLYTDTLFSIYTKIGASTPFERARNISRKIKTLYDDDFLKFDSLKTMEAEYAIDIVYGESIIMSVSELDAVMNSTGKQQMADEYINKIKTSIAKQKDKNSVVKLLLRIGLMILVIGGIGALIWLIGKGHLKSAQFIKSRKKQLFKDLSHKDYTFLSGEQELNLVIFSLKIVKWFIVIILLYLVLPLVFSIFPFTRGWANLLFGLVWSPFKGVLISVWEFLPNLFSILVIFFVMKYVIKFVRYIFTEIEDGNLKISGFYPDWAKPTYSILRFLLYAFMFVLMYPYLPGSSSDIFKGVSVFIGVLFSLGSSSAIANMVAGLVITYMRPFKIGDRIKIGDITGDVVEKNMLVTRIRTIKNEEITIPNSSVLSGNTTNYSSISKNDGLIMHTTVTIGYDVPWKDMHQALIDAALRTDLLMKEPKPFVLQTSLDDFYVSYQINGYTKDPEKQAIIYSDLHKNIQDVCNERGIEILSPHYRAARDGNMTTIPADYLPKDYESPYFNIRLKSKDDNNS